MNQCDPVARQGDHTCVSVLREHGDPHLCHCGYAWPDPTPPCTATGSYAIDYPNGGGASGPLHCGRPAGHLERHLSELSGRLLVEWDQ
jgi:hypothetical protein